MPSLRIIPTGAPDEMRRITCPLQLFSPSGKVTRRSMPLDGQECKFEVEERGRFLLRLEAPSGELFSAAASTDTEATILDLSDYPLSATEWSFDRLEVDSTLRFRKFLPGLQRQAFSRLAGGNAEPFGVFGLAGDSRTATELLDLDAYSFEGWDDERNLRLGPASYVHDRIFLPESVTLPYGVSANGPFYLWARAGDDGCLVPWPPFSGPSTLSFLPSPEGGFVVHSTGGDPNAEALFNYMLAGSLGAARSALENDLPSLLREKEWPQNGSEYVSNILFGYVLLRVAPDLFPAYLPLYFRFIDSADSWIQLGWNSIIEGRPERAINYFEEALDTGLPMFTEGIRLQLRGTNTLKELFPEHRTVARLFERANLIAASAVMESEVTCIKLGKLVARGLVGD